MMKRSALNILITKLLKKWISKRKHNSGIPLRTVHRAIINELLDRLKASVLVNGAHFEH